MPEIHLYDVLLRPLVTEKTNVMAGELGQYTFEVDVRANKIQIKEAVEVVFDVEVVKVRTIIMPAKRGRRHRGGWSVPYQRRKAWKKAIITLAPGDTIGLFNI